MANQKITDLNRSIKLSNEDLFIVVDKDEYGTSPTGETKSISAQILAEQLAEIKHNDVGIRFSELADVPNEYIDAAGAFIKIKDDGEGVEFTDSPGFSEISVSNDELFQNPESTQHIIYRVGDILFRDPNTNKYKLASSENPDMAEAVGMIRKIKRNIDGEVVSVNIAFGGHVVFTEPVHVEKYEVDVSKIIATESVLVGGKTYFLGRYGKLSDYDPSEQVNDSEPHVSKPMLIATGPTSGVFVNYRGLLSEKTEEPHKFVIEYSASCSKIKVGDIVRVRRKIKRNLTGGFGDSAEKVNEFDGIPENVVPSYLDFESGESPYVLANSASQDSPDALLHEDAYASEFVGIVTIATSDYFQIQTSGMVTFDIPSAMLSNTADLETKPNAIFKRGYTYYLDSFDITSDVNSYAEVSKRLRRTIYDYSSDELDDWFDNTNGDSYVETVTSGVNPFRNTTINNPFRRDPDTKRVVSYAKPVFYAVSENQILLLNHPVYPTPYDTCNAINPTLNEPCVSHTTEKTFTTTQPSTGTFVAKTYLNGVWDGATKGDVAILNIVDFNTASITTQKYVKVENNLTSGVNVNFGNWELLED